MSGCSWRSVLVAVGRLVEPVDKAKQKYSRNVEVENLITKHSAANVVELMVNKESEHRVYVPSLLWELYALWPSA